MAKIVYKDGSFKNCGYFYYNPDGKVTRVAVYEYGEWVRDEEEGER